MSDERVETRIQGADERPGPANVELSLGDIVDGRYRLEQFLSSGGMGRVWQAVDLDLGRQVAIKLMHPDLVATEKARVRFFDEARAAAKLSSRHVVAIHDVRIDAARKVPYLIMELLRGEDLSRRLARGWLNYEQTLAVLEGVCEALAEAHGKGLVHRDIKPANIFLPQSERELTATVLDFGIAKDLRREVGKNASVTMTGMPLGTVTYMSPEQANNASEVDHRADLWSLATVVFECLTGKRAFRAKSLMELGQEFHGPRPVPSKIADNLPPGFDEWFARATHPTLERRFQTAQALFEAFAALRSKTTILVTTPPPPPPKHRWAADANQLDINELAALTFKNKVVNEFLDSDRKHFVIGCKGLGKTLLLTYKRSLLHAQYQGGDPHKQAAIKFIPEGRPYLDLMSDLGTVGKSELTLMSSLSDCKRLWSFAFRVAAVSYLSERAHEGDDDKDELERMPAPIRAMLRGRKTEPTVVLKQLLSLPFGELKQLLDRSESYLEFRARALHSAVYMFIDKLDQALREVGRKAWVTMQAGMIEAAWDLMNTNAHIKIFATIREEAFASYESDIKTNLHGATTPLRYSRRDLREMLEKLTYFYERVPLDKFVSLDIVGSDTGARTEAPFDFIHRHTLGRPRDFVIIASDISNNRGALDQRTFARVVRDASANMLVANVFHEMRVFLDVLSDTATRNRFLGLLRHDILTTDEVIDIWCAFHGCDREYYEQHGSDAEDVYHPFRELFDCGLLGVIRHDLDNGRLIQHFRQPSDAVIGSHLQLPSSLEDCPYYLLHPALQTLIMHQAGGGSFRPFRYVLIGHGQPWPNYYKRLIDVQHELWRGASRGDEDTKDAIHELLGRFDEYMARGENFEVVRHQIAATSTFTGLTRRLERTNWEGLYYALLELFPSPPEQGSAPTPLPPPVEPQPAHEGDAELSLGPTKRASVAMLLIDIVDSTRLVERYGDTMLVEYLQELHQTLMQLPEPPHVVKGVGDGYLAVFDTVVSALVGARVLLQSTKSPEALRVVVHCGKVHLGKSDVIGAEVHRLFRLEKLNEDMRVGPPGEIALPTPGRPLLSSAALRDLPAPEQATFEKLGEFRLKGFGDPDEVWIERSDSG